MKYLIAAALAAVVASTSAGATTFDFSYAFADGTLTGSLEGTLVGSSIENVSNVQMQVDGVSFDQPLYTASYNLSTGDLSLGNPIISTNGAQNDFAFGNAPTTDATQYFLFVSAAGEVEANSPVADLDGPYNPANWSIQAAPPVPLPAAGWLLTSGIGLLGAWSRRRAGAQSAAQV